jgi:hypothetical protein
MPGFEVLVQFLRILFLTLAWLFCICGVLIMPVSQDARRAMLVAVLLAMALQYVQDRRRRIEG